MSFMTDQPTTPVHNCGPDPDPMLDGNCPACVIDLAHHLITEEAADNLEDAVKLILEACDA